MKKESERKSEYIEADLRKRFPSEPKDFTRHIAEEIDLVCDPTGLDLEVEDTEVQAGNKSVDILCKIKFSDGKAIIENMLGTVDWDHLGKLIGYPELVSARTAILIAIEVPLDIRKILNSLNACNPNRKYYALEIEYNKVSYEDEEGQMRETPPILRLNVVVKPDILSKTAGPLSERERGDIDYWEALGKAMDETDNNVSCKKPRAGCWLPFSSPSYLEFSAGIRQDKDNGEEYIAVSLESKNVDADLFREIKEKREQIESELGEKLDFKARGKFPSVRVLKKASANERSNWPEQHKWFARNANKFDAIILPIVKECASKIRANKTSF